MITTTVVLLGPLTQFEVTESAGINIVIRPVEGGQQLVLTLPSEDEDAMIMLDQIEAALDNAHSLARIRQLRREEFNDGLLGAGSSVEAYRG